MQLESLYIQVLPRLTNTGSTEQAQGVLQLESIEIGHRNFTVAEYISYDANLINTGEAVLLTGSATAKLSTQCDRCLEPTVLDISGEIQGYFLFDKTKLKDDENADDFEEVDSKGRVDIAPAILAAIVFEIPTVTLCEPDCKGITPPVAAEEIEEAVVSGEDDTPPHPFAALKDFKFE